MTNDDAIFVMEYYKLHFTSNKNAIEAFNMAISALENEPSISGDGTLTINVKDGSKVGRVLVSGDNHFGGLYYPDQEPCDKCVYSTSEGCQYDDITETIPPFDDCINRQAVLDAINTDWHEDLSQLEDAIKALPPVEPKTGHWIETAEEYYKAINEKGGGVNENTPYFTDDIACSECLAKFSVIDNETERFICCPNCGSKMESEET